MDPEEIKRKEMERKRRLMRGESLSELRALTEAELQDKYNALMEETSQPINRDAQMRYVARARIYADELARRESVEQGKRMETLTRSLNRLTWWIVALTVLIAVATVIGVALATLTLLSGA